MSRWPGKYVIGLTGNIATGKSLVRRMLEHLGAYGIDADALSHRAIARGAPGFRPVVETFGKWILNPNGEIDREKLGHLVFNNPEALKNLENIIHPLVEQAVDILVRRARQAVVVIEAIKILESDLGKECDTIWVTYSPEIVQKSRLMVKRNMSESEALQRICAQGSQKTKTSQASVVIYNISTFEDTWEQVTEAWKMISPAPVPVPPVEKIPAPDELYVQRGKPQDSDQIMEFIQSQGNGKSPLLESDISLTLGEKAFLLLKTGDQIKGLVAWTVENLVARTTDLLIDPSISVPQAINILITEVETASRDLQCEASLLFLSPEMASQTALWKQLGYEQRTPQTLGVLAWQEAAEESLQGNVDLFFKQLRLDRVLRPI